MSSLLTNYIVPTSSVLEQHVLLDNFRKCALSEQNKHCTATMACEVSQSVSGNAMTLARRLLQLLGLLASSNGWVLFSNHKFHKQRLHAAVSTTWVGRNGLNETNLATSVAMPMAAENVKSQGSVRAAKSRQQKDPSDQQRPKYYLFRQDLLSCIGLFPTTLTHAKGMYLHDDQGNAILDCLAQYGALPFGHNDDYIQKAVIDHLTSNQPCFVQPLFPETTSELSRRLCDLAGPNYYDSVIFTLSGAETVEAAIKLARTKTKRLKILSTINSFHGKTFSALSATGSTKYSTDVTVDTKNFDKVTFNDIVALREALSTREYAAFLVEPIQGEGGMVVADQQYLKEAERLCKESGTLFVLDEIQTGMGRTGTMFAKDQFDVQPDLLLLSKALGGGLYPIGAAIVHKTAYSKDFDKKHSSTFAGGGLGSAVALATIDRLLSDDLLGSVSSKSSLLKKGLDELQKKYPDVLVGVSGTGLMYSLTFDDPQEDQVGNMIWTITKRSALSFLICGFLFSEHNILSTPFLGSDNASIRVEPPLIITEAQIMRLLSAVSSVCQILKNQRFDLFFSHLIGRPMDHGQIPTPFIQEYLPEGQLVHSDTTRRKFAFLGHSLSIEDTLKQLPKPIQDNFSTAEQNELAEWIAASSKLDPETVTVSNFSMKSGAEDGEIIDGVLICATVLPADMMRMSREEKQNLMNDYIEEAKAQGVNHIIGLGAFTSIITRSGEDLIDDDEEFLFTSGNSFTAISTAEAIKEHAGAQYDTMGVTVIGARGTIGRLGVMELMQHFPRVNLVGSVRSRETALYDLLAGCVLELLQNEPLQNVSLGSAYAKLLNRLKEEEPDIDRLKDQLAADGGDMIRRIKTLWEASESTDFPFAFTTDVSTVVDHSNYVMSCTNDGKAFLKASMFLSGTVIFDVSRPFDVSIQEAEKMKNVQVIEAGMVSQPQPILITSTNIAHHPAGVNLACLSETIALCMEGVDHHYSIGKRIEYKEAREVYEICRKHGFAPHYPGRIER